VLAMAASAATGFPAPNEKPMRVLRYESPHSSPPLTPWASPPGASAVSPRRQSVSGGYRSPRLR
jgi:hypothetical protein